jgi:N-acylneuraminate cytidylyltransferase/CMP-N,N'-diacetyllegionaminic acid synthase
LEGKRETSSVVSSLQSKRAAAIIPARGGSKGIPGKNLKPAAGKPLIAWTVETALAATLLDRVIVSTDSPEIADVARRYGAEVPFMRPAHLAQDDTPGIAPVLHAAQWLADNEGYQPDMIMLLQPTSPLRIPEDIDRAIELIREKGADAIVSVTPVEAHPYWMKQIDGAGRMTDFIKLDQPIERRQDLPELYTVNGAIYVARYEVLMQQKTFDTDNTFSLVMPPERSLDIDTPWDLCLADLILKDRRRNEAC